MMNSERQANRGSIFYIYSARGGDAHSCPRQLRHCPWGSISTTL